MLMATPETYAAMLDRSKTGGFAYPSINVTSSETITGAIKGFADVGSDGIIQVSTGGAEFASGTAVKDMMTGAVALVEFAHVVAAKYGMTAALQTDGLGRHLAGHITAPMAARVGCSPTDGKATA